VLKYDADTLKAAHEKVLRMAKLGATSRHVRREVFPAKDATPGAWAYLDAAEAPADWMQPAFDDAGWKRGTGGFGDANIGRDHAAAKVATPWTTKVLRLRRAFDYTGDARVVGAIYNMFHDEDTVVYLNGRKVFAVSGYNTKYDTFAAHDEAFAKALRKGRNVLAVEVRQTSGSQYFDCGLALDLAE